MEQTAKGHATCTMHISSFSGISKLQCVRLLLTKSQTEECKNATVAFLGQVIAESSVSTCKWRGVYSLFVNRIS